MDPSISFDGDAPHRFRGMTGRAEQNLFFKTCAKANLGGNFIGSWVANGWIP
jgi:hypothetical protein